MGTNKEQETAADTGMGEHESSDEEEEEENNKIGILTEADEGLGEDLEEEEEDDPSPDVENMMSSGEPAKRRAGVLRLLEGRGGVAAIVDYSYDTNKQSWASVSLAFDIA